MTNVSKNSMDFIKVAGEKVKGKFGKAFLATLMMVAPLMLCVFTVYAIPLAIIFFGVFETGYIRFMRALLNGENPGFGVMFSEFKTPWLEIFLGAIMVCMFVLGTVILIVPGAILIAYYSMSLFVAEKEKIVDPGVALKETSKKMNGNIASMFAYKTLFWVFYILVIFGGIILGLLGYKLWADHVLLALLVIFADYLVVTGLWSLITVYYHTANELFFNEMLYCNEVRKARKQKQKVEIINEAGDVQETKAVKAEEVKAEEKAPAKKPATKTTTKTAGKTTTKPATKTATKPATAKKTTTKTTKTNE